jgi:hypothetical protein
MTHTPSDDKGVPFPGGSIQSSPIPRSERILKSVPYVLILLYYLLEKKRELIME